MHGYVIIALVAAVVGSAYFISLESAMGFSGVLLAVMAFGSLGGLLVLGIRQLLRWSHRQTPGNRP